MTNVDRGCVFARVPLPGERGVSPHHLLRSPDGCSSRCGQHGPVSERARPNPAGQAEQQALAVTLGCADGNVTVATRSSGWGE
jgi:hypothetical protein